MIMSSVNMETMVLKKEIEGFIVNRIQSAVLHEAFRLVAEGIADYKDVDLAVTKALSPRWSFIGPFATIDLNAPGGVADYIRRYGEMYKNLGESQLSLVDWAETAEDGLESEIRNDLPVADLKEKCSWRDRRLMSFQLYLQNMEKDLAEF